MSQLAAYVETITRHYPGLAPKTAVMNHDGQYNDVLIVDDALVFRFARVPAAIRTLRHEVALQASLQGRLSLPIPDPIYAHLETGVAGEAFVGYRCIPGAALWREAFRAIDDALVRDGMAAQLARFLRELHHVPAEVLPDDLPRHETPAEMAELYTRIGERLFGYMRPDARHAVTAHFQPFLDAPERYPFRPCLRHGDFGTGNILHDPEQGRITGILDFAAAGIGDPAVDFAGLLTCYGIEFYQRCATTYPEMAETLDRVHFYRGTFALQEALFGIENDDREAFEAGMAEYV